MTAILQRRESTTLWARFCEWITSTDNRLYIGWFGVLMSATRQMSFGSAASLSALFLQFYRNIDISISEMIVREGLKMGNLNK